MSQRDPDIVTASEIASWVWCPESWRLEALGHEPENQKAMRRGETFHADTAGFEVGSRAAISLGWWLLGLGLLLAAAFVLVRGL
jgi:hypothetical protein